MTSNQPARVSVRFSRAISRTATDFTVRLIQVLPRIWWPLILESGLGGPFRAPAMGVAS